jgi:hypothetical protein
VIIGIVGKAGSGKDTVAHMIPGAKLLSFADPLKEFCAQVFEWNRNTLWGPSENRNRPDPRYGGLTPRHALQTLGTQWGRACYENVWVDLGIRRAKEWLETQVDIVGGDYAVRSNVPLLRSSQTADSSTRRRLFAPQVVRSGKLLGRARV